jgi:short-chain fatty acids transporter
MPDPLILAIGLAALVAFAAALVAPQGSLPVIVTSWYSGIFGILTFAFQMILILVAGHALAYSPACMRALKSLTGLARTPGQAVVITYLIASTASWISWGFGLVIAGVVAREMARRVRVDFAWLVAAAYSGFVIYTSGVSASIPLAQASHANALNIVEKVTGHILPFGQTIFTAFNLVPMFLTIAIMPFVLLMIRPRDDEVQVFVPQPEPPPAAVKPRGDSFAAKLNTSPLPSLLLVAAGVAYAIVAVMQGKLEFDINFIIFVFLTAGIALHRTPLAYAEAIRNAAKQTGPLMLQYPIYGGIMGMMTATGLAEQISRAIAGFATAHTLPFLSFVSSIFISMIIPSGGGHWAVQGPFTVPAAVALNASIPATTMGVAMGEGVANMLQPFWALPVVAIAGIGIQRVLGLTVVTFVVSAVIFGAALLLLV